MSTAKYDDRRSCRSVMGRLIILSGFLCAFIPSAECSAQKYSLGTNLVGWADLITINVSGGAALSRMWSAEMGVRYNPWSFGSGEDTFRNRKFSVKGGIRFWPWYVYSGWWIGVDAQYMLFNRGGLFSSEVCEGEAVGGVLSFGYSKMLSPHWNVEFGASVWAGSMDYSRYECPVCGRLLEKGMKLFILPDDVLVSFYYVF